jgi:hypothetical protein
MGLLKWLLDGAKTTIGSYIFTGAALILGALMVWHFIIPDMNTVKEWFGADTKVELKAKLNNANISILDLTNKNAACQLQLTKADSSCKVQLETLQRSLAYQNKANADLEVQNSKRAEKIKNIQSQASKQTATTANQIVLNTTVATKISEVQVGALWDAYCAKNSSDECTAEQGEQK